MGGLEVIDVVERWERAARDRVALDGPLDPLAKALLISFVSDFLALKCKSVQDLEPQQPVVRKRGRPRKQC